MSKHISADLAIMKEIAEDAAQTKNWGIVLILSGLLIQTLHVFKIPVNGIWILLILTGLILAAFGIRFLLVTTSLPKNRMEIIYRFQLLMLSKNPDRRLWAAQRLIGYAKSANFTKEEIYSLSRHAKKIVEQPPVEQQYMGYIAVDHLILLREIAVGVKMNKHVRKDFIKIIKPLQKIVGFPDEAYEILADAIAYHPSKLPVQAYLDYQKDSRDT
ncbi:MAG: hypothetical protein HeimC2_10080 [Candidatus Heimdallarchaeota archaeon LC_2]|nr:MAG: hypothetical protein HeimC2_10080 [Candidatus Heimdallarchaeota archaeon LC_2]